MTLVMGIDAGLGGALATYDPDTRRLEVTDMPTWREAVGNKTRERVNAVALMDYLEMRKMMGVQLVMIESVGGRPAQSAGAAFVFGYVVGLIYMACISVRLPIETVPSRVWKKIMNVPGKTEITKTLDGGIEKRVANKALETAIIKRADELFPEYTDVWRGTRGGYRLDRAEAALLAAYATRQRNMVDPIKLRDAEFSMVYRAANTGA